VRGAIRWLHKHEAVRQALQMVVAVTIAFVASVALGLREPSWAVLSALLVVQGSVGGTVTGAFNRVVGAAIGLALGLLIILVLGVEEWRQLVSLVIAVGVMAVIAGHWQRLRYGLVTVAILVVAPGQELFEDSLLIAGEVAIGAVSGALAGAVVLPVAAHRSALRHLGRAVQACGRLLKASMQELAADGEEDVSALQEEIKNELDEAREMMSQSRRTRPSRHLPSQFEMLRHVDRLWYTLALVNRLRGRRLPDAAMQRVREPLEKATEAAADYLEELGSTIAAAERPAPAPERLESVSQLVAAVDDLRDRDLVPSASEDEAEALFTLSFVWQQINSNTGDLAACAAGDTDS
jgi:uncharacterized membrane protein YccC